MQHKEFLIESAKNYAQMIIDAIVTTQEIDLHEFSKEVDPIDAI